MHRSAVPLLLCACWAQGAEPEQPSQLDYPGPSSADNSDTSDSTPEQLDSVLDRLQMEIQTAQPGRTHVFWHIGNGQAQKGQRDQIVRAQLAEIQGSKLHKDGKTPVHFVLNTNQINPQTVQLLQSTPGFKEVPKSPVFSATPDIETYEFPTLTALYDHCSSNPNDMVAYIHSKSDGFWRRELQKKVLDEYDTCLSNMAQGSVTCGPRYSRGIAGWCHYSGNFWWSRCDHVKKLEHPFSPNVQTDLKGNRNWGHDWPPYGRYVAEYWLLNGMDVQTPHTRPPQLPYPSSFVKDKCTPVKAFVQTIDPTHGMGVEFHNTHPNNFVANLEVIRLAELAQQLEETPNNSELESSLVTYDLSLESAVSRYELSLEMGDRSNA